jgi:hypothetical protein
MKTTAEPRIDHGGYGEQYRSKEESYKFSDGDLPGSPRKLR